MVLKLTTSIFVCYIYKDIDMSKFNVSQQTNLYMRFQWLPNSTPLLNPFPDLREPHKDKPNLQTLFVQRDITTITGQETLLPVNRDNLGPGSPSGRHP